MSTNEQPRCVICDSIILGHVNTINDMNFCDTCVRGYSNPVPVYGESSAYLQLRRDQQIIRSLENPGQVGLYPGQLYVQQGYTTCNAYHIPEGIALTEPVIDYTRAQQAQYSQVLDWMRITNNLTLHSVSAEGTGWECERCHSSEGVAGANKGIKVSVCPWCDDEYTMGRVFHKIDSQTIEGKSVDMIHLRTQESSSVVYILCMDTFHVFKKIQDLIDFIRTGNKELLTWKQDFQDEDKLYMFLGDKRLII